ncbi:MAG: purine-nucleoside phosphorylase [Ezakiella sp.]|nr:purine-nucleoside phosphorylase [Ezakiella sp.]MDD7761602.1 purine-nucleoside phosphorylase [Bacillota bacterium]MDY3947468.1 purine-nucleoside phosphorylase [Ezakiella sp.]
MSTAHNRANKGDINKTVLMPGDPLRAKFIAENFFTDVKQFNDIRNMLGYSGNYKGEPFSVMGSGMGIPSIGIYSHELYSLYDVEKIIRVGSCGSYQEDIELFDIIIAQGSSSDSNFHSQFNLNGQIAALADFNSLEKAVAVARKAGKKIHVGNVFSSDVFYNYGKDEWKKWSDMGILAVEMESYGLYLTAQSLGKSALTILTVSDSFHTKKETTPEERERSFTDMIEIALESCLI